MQQYIYEMYKYVYIELLDQKKKEREREVISAQPKKKKERQFKAREKQPTEHPEHNNFEVGGLATTVRSELKFQKFNRPTGGPHVLEKKRKNKIKICAKRIKKS